MKIFINYRREDARDAAFIIAKSLMARFGEHNVFFDRQGIQAGENFVTTIESAFKDCRLFIPLIGREWNNILASRHALGERDFVLEEISNAIDKGVRIIPVVLDEAEMPLKKDLPEMLHPISEVQAFFLSTNPKRLPYDLENLNAVVMKNLADLRVQPEPVSNPPNPVPSSPDGIDLSKGRIVRSDQQNEAREKSFQKEIKIGIPKITSKPAEVNIQNQVKLGSIRLESLSDKTESEDLIKIGKISINKN